jgi:hypothetical protein
MSNRFGGTEKIEAVGACAVYDPATGDIHHWHHCITIAGGRHPSLDELSKDALAAAARVSPNKTDALRVLHTEFPAEPGKLYRVDHEQQKLITYSKPA